LVDKFVLFNEPHQLSLIFQPTLLYHWFRLSRLYSASVVGFDF